jgi:HK97 family phage major capsid protein
MSEQIARIEELASQMESLRSVIEELQAIEEPTQDQAERFDRAANDYEAVEAEHRALVEKAERAARARTILATKPKQVERGFHAPEVITRKSPYEDPEAIRQGLVDDLVGRARAAIDEDRIMPSDDARARAYELAGNRQVARHMLLTGSPEYRSAFQKWVANPQHGSALFSPEEREAVRAAMSLTVGNGGYLIPQQLDPTIILTNNGTTNPFRAVARVESGTVNVWEGVSSAGVNAQWLAEGTEAADASPTVAAPTVTAHKAAAYVFGSYEVLQDSNFEAQLPRLLSDAKDRLESAAFAVGSGSGAPFGVVTSVTAVTTSRVTPTTGGSFTTESLTDVYKVINAVPARHRSRASWVANFATLNIIRQMDTYGGGSFWANLNPDTPEQLLGRPVYESSEMVSAVTTGSNILLAGDFSEYLIYDRIGTTLVYDPVVLGSNRIPSGQAGFFAFWRVGADVTNANAFRVLKL